MSESMSKSKEIKNRAKRNDPVMSKELAEKTIEEIKDFFDIFDMKNEIEGKKGGELPEDIEESLIWALMFGAIEFNEKEGKFIQILTKPVEGVGGVIVDKLEYKKKPLIFKEKADMQKNSDTASLLEGTIHVISRLSNVSEETIGNLGNRDTIVANAVATIFLY